MLTWSIITNIMSWIIIQLKTHCVIARRDISHSASHFFFFFFHFISVIAYVVYVSPLFSSLSFFAASHTAYARCLCNSRWYEMTCGTNNIIFSCTESEEKDSLQKPYIELLPTSPTLTTHTFSVIIFNWRQASKIKNRRIYWKCKSNWFWLLKSLNHITNM